MEFSYTDHNSKTIDSWCETGWEWGRPIDHETYLRALAGDWFVLLTPTVPVPRAWFGDLKGARVLGLASGGGQQAPIFTAAGARCTVIDYSAKQIESEQLVADREGYNIDLVRADITQGLPFADASFDLIFHPVSNCYIEDVLPVWRECARVLRPGGVLLSGLDNGINYVVDQEEKQIIRGLPFNPLKNEALKTLCLENYWGMQFSHTIEEQIGGQLKAGFVLTDIYQDTNGQGRLHELGIPCFHATRAVKKDA